MSVAHDDCDAKTAFGVIRPPLAFRTKQECARAATLGLPELAVDFRDSAYPVIRCTGADQ